MASNVAEVLTEWLRRALTDPALGPLMALLVVLGDAVLSQLIIRFVSYTEIDWETYMYQVELYLKGERNYALISGPTGPLVYPTGHVYIHEFLYKLTSTGLNIPLAQQIYWALYIVSLAVSCAIYLQAGNVPNCALLLLPLNKRLHSIYLLRLFNDCWASVGAQAAILALGAGWDSVGITLMSLALSVKMSVLLYIPGLIVVLLRRRGLAQTLLFGVQIILLQSILAKPFLLEHPLEYLAGAFDLSRAFLFKWTVNWRFVGEEIFLSPLWAKSLLVGHLTTLIAFAHFKWCHADGGLNGLLKKSLKDPFTGSAVPVTADYITTVLVTSNLIGITFARSLHYQFYSWYAQQIPFLLWRSSPTYSIKIKLCILLCFEFAWNVFPSTKMSSVALLMANSALLIGVWNGWPTGVDRQSQRPVKEATPS